VAVSVSSAMLEPAIVLPVQVVDRRILQPEERLMLAVLEDAVATLLGHGCTRTGRRRRVVEEVDGWVNSDATDWPFAFVRICDGLGIDPDYLRGGLERMRRVRDSGSTPSPLRRFRRLAGARHAIGLRCRRAV